MGGNEAGVLVSIPLLLAILAGDSLPGGIAVSGVGPRQGLMHDQGWGRRSVTGKLNAIRLSFKHQ